MFGRRFLSSLVIAGVSLGVFPASQASAFDASGFAGGMLGAAIAGAMISNAQQQRPVYVYRTQRVYQSQRVYRRAPQRVVARRAPPLEAPRAAAVVDTSVDPFASKSAVATIPISSKP